MPRERATREELNRYQRENHAKKADIILRLGQLFLGDEAKNTEAKDILRIVHEEMLKRHPEGPNLNNRQFFRRTVEFDGERQSVWVSADVTQNRAKFDQKLAEMKIKKEMAEKRTTRRPVVLKKPVKPPVRPSPLTLPQKQILVQPNPPRRHQDQMKKPESSEPMPVDNREFVPAWHQPNEDEEWLYKQPQVEETLEVDLNKTWEAVDEPDELAIFDDTDEDDKFIKKYNTRYGEPFDLANYLDN